MSVRRFEMAAIFLTLLAGAACHSRKPPEAAMPVAAAETATPTPVAEASVTPVAEEPPVASPPEAPPSRGRDTAAIEDQANRALVSLLQERLDDAGFSTGAHDGRFGPKTFGALARFQQEKFGHGRGIPDGATLTALFGPPTPEAVQNVSGRDEAPVPLAEPEPQGRSVWPWVIAVVALASLAGNGVLFSRWRRASDNARTA